MKKLLQFLTFDSGRRFFAKELFLGIEKSKYEFSTIYFFFNNCMAISHEIESIF